MNLGLYNGARRDNPHHYWIIYNLDHLFKI